MRIKLIIESGSTKADWVFFSDSSKLDEFQTKGLNPKVISLELLDKIIGTKLSQFDQPIVEIFFYGSGIIGKEQEIKSILNKYQPDAIVEVQSDLVAAARASYDKDERLVCILGTGSYSGKFKNNELIESKLGHGYILGDVCGGSEFGKILLKDYMDCKVPEAIERAIDLNRSEVITSLYKSEYPNRFLASFFPIFVKFRDTSYCQKIISNQIQLLLDRGIEPLLSDETKKISFIGSVGFQLQDEITNIFKIKTELEFIERPINNLFQFHQNS